MKQNTTKSFNIYVMSYKRPHKIMTQSIFEYCTYVVREEEAEAYKESGVKNILAIPEEAEVFDFMSTLYWIIDNTPEDVIFIADDDIKSMIYRIDDSSNIKSPEIATSEVERIAQLVVDLEIGFATDNPHKALYGYDREFAFKGMPGHIRWINKEHFKAKYNKEDEARSDIDLMYQELLTNRITICPKYFLSNAMMDKNEGILEDRQEHVKMVYAMKNKWGKYYNYDFKKNIASIDIKR